MMANQLDGRDVWRRSEINQIMTALEYARPDYTDAFDILRQALGIIEYTATVLERDDKRASVRALIGGEG
jgi:hypothetical protein